MLIFGSIIIAIILWGNGIILVENNDNHELLNQISVLNSQLSEKDMLILQYKKELLDLTLKYQDIEEAYIHLEDTYLGLEETYELTKHSLNLANEALNSINEEAINDSDDYE